MKELLKHVEKMDIKVKRKNEEEIKKDIGISQVSFQPYKNNSHQSKLSQVKPPSIGVISKSNNQVHPSQDLCGYPKLNV